MNPPKAEIHANVQVKRLFHSLHVQRHKGPILYFVFTLGGRSDVQSQGIFYELTENVHNKLIKWFLPLKCVFTLEELVFVLRVWAKVWISEKVVNNLFKFIWWCILWKERAKTRKKKRTKGMVKITNAFTWWILHKVNEWMCISLDIY